MISFPTMNKRAFSLIELLIVVAIIAVLVGVAMPYYQDYVKETKLTKAKHELDILKEALVKYDTMEDKPFDRNDLRVLLGKYLQDLPRDPWGRDYNLDYIKGQVWSNGPDNQDPRDDIVVDYKPPLALQKATIVDADKDRHISPGDFIRLEFSRYFKDGIGITYDNASQPAAGADLWFSPDVAVSALIATSTPATSTELLIEFGATASDTAVYPGSSTVRIAPGNDGILDQMGNGANGTDGEYPGIEVIIKAD
ncbi:MAG: hypothetical protein Kow0029_29820 [Candidatus Rifleibacteriota bacterium]